MTDRAQEQINLTDLRRAFTYESFGVGVMDGNVMDVSADVIALIDAVEAAAAMLGECAVIDDGSGTLIACSDALARFSVSGRETP